MKHKHDHIEDKIQSIANHHRVEVPTELWGKLESRLENDSVKRLTIRHWLKIAAVLLPLLIAGTFLFQRSINASSSEVTDLSAQVNDVYFSEYRDFLQSKRYARLVEDYDKGK